MVEPIAVACHDVRMAQVRDGETAVVIGGGPIGVLIALVARSKGARVITSEVNPFRIQLARELGAEVVVTVGSPQKARFCVAFGARAAFNYRQEDFAAAIEQLYGGEGVDVVLDMIGGAYLARNVRVLRRDGRLVFIAIKQGGHGELDLRAILMRRLHLTGSTMRPRSLAEKTAIRDALRQRIWPALADGRVRSHVHATFPMDEARQAHELMESSEHIGKLVLRIRD